MKEPKKTYKNRVSTQCEKCGSPIMFSNSMKTVYECGSEVTYFKFNQSKNCRNIKSEKYNKMCANMCIFLILFMLLIAGVILKNINT